MNNHRPANRPIGIFDSGIGGLTVANALVKALPEEEIIYFGDTAHLPYGDKSADAIRYYSLKIVKFLLDRDCKMIVIACNSASTAAYRVLLEFFHDRTLFASVVDPLVERVSAQRYQKVGVIATKATVRSAVYEQQLKALQPTLNVSSLATPLLVPMIEEGYVDGSISQAVIDQYLSDSKLQDIEALLLACTHYPLIRPQIEQYYKGSVRVFDSTDVVTDQVKNQLAAHQLLNDQRRNPHRFFVSDYTQSFEETTRIFYEEEVELEHYPMW